MRCNNLLKENLLTCFLFISNISFLCPQGWAVIGKKNSIFLSFSNPTQVEQALALCPPTFIPDVTLANLSGCNQATIGKRALLALGLETKEKQIGGCLESSTYFGFPMALPSNFYYFCNGNWSLVSGAVCAHTKCPVLSGADFWLDLILLILIWESDGQGKHSYASSLHAGKEHWPCGHAAMQSGRLRISSGFVYRSHSASQWDCSGQLYIPEHLFDLQPYCLLSLLLLPLESSLGCPLLTGVGTLVFPLWNQQRHFRLRSDDTVTPSHTLLLLCMVSLSISLRAITHSFDAFFTSTYPIPASSIIW